MGREAKTCNKCHSCNVRGKVQRCPLSELEVQYVKVLDENLQKLRNNYH